MTEITEKDLQPMENPGDGWFIIESAGDHPTSTTIEGQEVHFVQHLTPEAIAAIAEAGVPAEGLLVDRDHQSLNPTQPSEAFGWLRELAVCHGSLAGRIEWTPLGLPLIQGKVYRHFSSVYPPDHAAMRAGSITPTRLVGLALTNQPNNATGQPPITNRQRTPFEGNPLENQTNPTQNTMEYHPKVLAALESLARLNGTPAFCLDSRHRHARLNPETGTWTTQFCLESKHRHARLANGHAATASWFCLESKHRHARLANGHAATASWFCLESKHRHARLAAQRAPHHYVFCLESKHRHARLLTCADCASYGFCLESKHRHARLLNADEAAFHQFCLESKHRHARLNSYSYGNRHQFCLESKHRHARLRALPPCALLRFALNPNTGMLDSASPAHLNPRCFALNPNTGMLDLSAAWMYLLMSFALNPNTGMLDFIILKIGNHDCFALNPNTGMLD